MPVKTASPPRDVVRHSAQTSTDTQQTTKERRNENLHSAAAEIHLVCYHGPPRVPLLFEGAVLTRPLEYSFLIPPGYNPRSDRGMFRLRKPIRFCIRDEDHRVRAALCHMLQYMPGHPRWWEAIPKCRFSRAWNSGDILGQNVRPGRAFAMELREKW